MIEQVKKAGADFSNKELMPQWERLDSGDAGLRNDILSAAARNGVFGFVIPEDLGGSGFGVTENCVFLEEISKCCPGAASLFAAHFMGLTPYLLSSSSEAAARIMRTVTDAEQGVDPCVLAMAASETSHDLPDAENLKTRLLENSGGYLLSGLKANVAGAAVAGHFTVLASPENGKPAWVSVSATKQGVVIGNDKHTTGLRFCPINDVTFDNVEVGPEDIIPADGVAGIVSCYEYFDAPIGAIALGAARAAYEKALQYSVERYQGGQLICDHDAVRMMLADMSINIKAASALVSGDRSLVAAAFACGVAEKACLDSIQIHGGYGYMQDYRVERLLRDVKTLRAMINPQAKFMEYIKRDIENNR